MTLTIRVMPPIVFVKTTCIRTNRMHVNVVQWVDDFDNRVACVSYKCYQPKPAGCKTFDFGHGNRTKTLCDTERKFNEQWSRIATRDIVVRTTKTDTNQHRSLCAKRNNRHFS